MLYLQAWHLGLVLRTLSESLASVDPNVGRRRWMKAKCGRMQQKSRTQTSCSADNMLCMSLGNWDMACISKRHSGYLQLSWEDTGPYKLSWECHTQACWCIIVSILAQCPIFREPRVSTVREHTQHKGKAHGNMYQLNHRKSTRDFSVSDCLF